MGSDTQEQIETNEFMEIQEWVSYFCYGYFRQILDFKQPIIDFDC